MPENPSDRALLSFMIGSVQPFIEAARTVRDLWTGSYLISWLTASAMKPIIEGLGTQVFVTPFVDLANPLLRAMLGGTKGDANATQPSLPNKFSAQVPASAAEALRDACLAACRKEWEDVAKAVHDELSKTFDRFHPGWDRDWDAQLASCLEIRCVVRPVTTSQDDSREWLAEWDDLGALMEMTRSVRHVPDYRPMPDKHYPAKCSLLGTFEQMGPAEFDKSREFWGKLASPKWTGVSGTRLQTSDKLCAVSLVKRFAWPAYLAGRLGLQVNELRYSDTATLAAGEWLAKGDRDQIHPDQFRRHHQVKTWSGQWLHWPTQEGDEDEHCPQEAWERIKAKKVNQGAPPIYYAILAMDADCMGETFKGDRGPTTWGRGRARYQQITRRLTTLALRTVRPIVEDECHGELIYAGGDDVLAFLPTRTAVECARKIREALRAESCLGVDGSISGGIAVVHYKEDLRFALERARAAEKAAKRIGKERGRADVKDALALSVCRRSGEHTTTVLGWEQAEPLVKLTREFAREDEKVSDRWAYKLRAELPTLRGLPLDACLAETMRLVGRMEDGRLDFANLVKQLFEDYAAEMRKPERNWPNEQILDGFVTLCQSASFLARGSD